MEKKKIFENVQMPVWLEKTWNVLKIIGRVIASICKWIFRLRGFFMAIPVALAALYLAWAITSSRSAPALSFS